MEHVELLLVLAEDPALRIGAERAAELIHSDLPTATKRLRDLETAGLLQQSGHGQEQFFSYGPRSGQMREAVAELAKMYHHRPVTLVRAIYERPVSPVRSFADAFRIREDR